MVHAVRIRNGVAMYSNKYVNTLRLQTEEAAGRPLYIKIGDIQGLKGLFHLLISALRVKTGICKVTATTKTAGTGNTALEYHAGRLLALHEGDVPYVLSVLCDGVLETIGALTFDGKLQTPFTAHPKVVKDADGGETMYAFGYSLDKLPYVTFHVIDTHGKHVRAIPVDLPAPVMMHDFAVTARHAVFLDFPVKFEKEGIVSGKGLFVFDKSAPARFGLLPLDAADASQLEWYTLPAPRACFHTLNAWEGANGRSVHVVLCEMMDMDLSHLFPKPNTGVDMTPRPVHYVIDRETHAVTCTPVCRLPDGVALDFPQINRTYLGIETRYGYGCLFDQTKRGNPPIGFAKLDLTAPPDAPPLETVFYEKGRLGGEMLFVPDPSRAKNGKGLAEDAGYIVGFVLDEATRGDAELLVYDAQHIQAGPVATVALPPTAKVPLGFHAIFVGEKELAEIKKTTAAATSAAAVL
ncbi:unnamed protein product [Phaeothamnion confervicola]